MTEVQEAPAAIGRPKYPHLENLETILTRDPSFLDQPVSVTEKLHGFNARIGRDEDGVAWYGGRNEDYPLVGDGRPGLQGFRDYAESVETLPLGTTLYGEWAGKGVQKGIDYGEKKFYLFAVREGGGGPVLSTAAVLDQYWQDLGVATVPPISEGVVRLDDIDALRRGESIVAPGQPIEGVVLAPLAPVYDKWHHQVIAKFKSPAFAERASAKSDRPPVDMENASGFAAEYVNDERLRHVLDQVAEANRVSEAAKAMVERSGFAVVDDPLDVRHTGDVLKAMYADVVREGQDDFDALDERDQKLVGKAVNKETLRLLVALRDEQLRRVLAVDGQEGS